jgi:hypothetical protein
VRHRRAAGAPRSMRIQAIRGRRSIPYARMPRGIR